LPSVSSIPNLTTVPPIPNLTTVLSIPNVTTTPTLPSSIVDSNKKSIFESEDQILIIHSICDIILFYMVFRYISNMFSHTKQSIVNCRESLQKLREQYGLQID
jgi:hypothetical protein